MGCCGDEDENLEEKNREASQQGNGFVNQQPGPLAGPGQEKFQAPFIASPAPTHSSLPGSQQWLSGAIQTPPRQFPGASLPRGPLSPNATGSFSMSGPSQNGMPHMAPVPTPQEQGKGLHPDEGRMSVAIDFGTTFSGVVYGSSRIAGGQVQQILNWPGSQETFRKIPTCLLYNQDGHVIAWGLEAKNASIMPGTMKCEWFKLFLEPKALRDESAIDPRLPHLPPGKRSIDLIVDFLTCLWEYAKDQITREIGAVADLNSANVWLTVPAAWDAKGCEIMREAAISAGLVHSSKAGDREWRDRLRIITEPEAAAVHCANLTDVHKLKPSQNFIVVDAGGGTVDLAVYKLIGMLANLEIAEMAARSGANCGSLFLDLRFRELVKTLLSDHPAHLDAASLAYFMHTFSDKEKLDYSCGQSKSPMIINPFPRTRICMESKDNIEMIQLSSENACSATINVGDFDCPQLYGGVRDDDNMFYFNCFNVEDPEDASVGLMDGQLSIPGNLLRREVFDPVINQVIDLIEDQINRLNLRVDALVLVGGFAGCEYLKQRVNEQFGRRVPVIARPPDADTATLRGAARYGLARRSLVSSVIAPRSYVMKVKLPADQEDWMKRPAYIKNNDSGVPICENRLQYLVQKGAILRKGQRLVTKFCKYSSNAQDATFVATFFTSDSGQVMRYADEGELTELCKWTVDLAMLPTFQQNSHQNSGFYTEFDLGLEVDSVEVRGILLYQGQEWGRVTFDFFS